MQPLNIGQAAARSGLSAKMIRHYEAIGLLPAAVRSDSGYRLYGPDALETLTFIKRARDLGFSLEAVGELLALKRDSSRASADVKALARRHIRALDAHIQALGALRDNLQGLVDQCQGNASAECAILEQLTTADPQA